jgi:hypothetical protein
MKTIKKSIEISSPKESVWAVLMEDRYNRDWMAHFSPGTHAVTDWIVGHKVVFTDGSNRGIFGRIAEKRPYEYLEIEYDGMLLNGQEDFNSEESKAVKGSKETYSLSAGHGNTVLSITSDMDEKYFDHMAATWDSALQRISELSHTI